MGLLCLLLSCVTTANAQTGPEWIRTYQTYFKFPVVKSGIYRIDSAAAGVIALRNPQKIQLFCNGKEQHLYVKGAEDGVFNTGDYLEFVADPNNGDLDRELYRTPAEQPQQLRSLFEDTAWYFMTALPDSSVSLPKRALLVTDTSYSLYTPENSFQVKQAWVPQEDYYYGAFLPADQKYYLSEYGDAEGMMSYLIGQGQSRSYTFQTPNQAAGAGASLEIKILGASDYYLENPSSPNHHVKIWSVANNGIPQLLIDTTFRGYGERIFQRNLTGAQVGDSVRIVFEVINDIGVGSDFIGISYVKLDYQRKAVAVGIAEDLWLNTPIVAPYIRLQHSGFSGNTVVWDAVNQRRTLGQFMGGNLHALLPSLSFPVRILMQEESNIYKVNSLKPVSTNLPDPDDNAAYLIVSSRSLKTAAEAYQTYRSKKHKTQLVYAEDLYDWFTYGQKHPLAIRRYCSYLYSKQVNPPAFLLLLGRGYQNNLIKMNPGSAEQNLVPAIGVPSSDHLFTAGFAVNTGAPAIATGRVPATGNIEALNYLNKVIDFETNPDTVAEWKKNYLHLSGGSYSSQQTEFRNQLAQLGSVVKDKPIGGWVNAYFKTTTAPTDNNLKQTLVNHLNSGVHMMTFYGHGSLTVLDMDFGGINDLAVNNKPSFFYFNGCNIGNANDVDPLGTGLVYGKDYICASGKGALGWLAHTNLTFTNHLVLQMNQFYQQLSMNYGKPVGMQLKTALENAASSNDAFARSHALQLLLQGDPALVLYAPSRPDFGLQSSDLFVTPADASVQSDSLSVGIILHNLGKAVSDSVHIKLTRTLPDNSVKTYPELVLPSPYYRDTFYLRIRDLEDAHIGLNRFDVVVNEAQTINEISYANNSASLSWYLPGSGIRLMRPASCEIVSTDSVTLMVQNNDLFAPASGYLFEIDTSLNFTVTSPLYRSSGPVLSGPVAQWTISLIKTDSMVYFWRARLNLPENQGGRWVTGSFVYLGSGPEGWHQQDYRQFRNTTDRNLIAFNDSSGKFEFSNNELSLGIENRRWDHRRMGVIIPYLLNAGVGSCISQGTVALVFEPYQVDFPVELPNYPFNCAFVQANKSDQSVRYYPFNTNTIQGEQDLARLIDSVPEGYYVALFSRYSSGIENWNAATKARLSSIGSIKVQQITNPYTAWAVIGKKGEATGLAVEDTVTNNELAGVVSLPPLPNEPQDEKYLRVRRTIQLKWFTGTFETERIGPAKKFTHLKAAFDGLDPLPSGRWWMDIIGTKADGKDTTLMQGITSAFTDLQSIAANVVPYLRIRIGSVDSTYRTPFQPHFLQVAYTGTPEYSVASSPSYRFYADAMEEGDSVDLQLPVINFGRSATDTSFARVELQDENRKVVYTSLEAMAPLTAMIEGSLKKKISTRGLNGPQSLQIWLNDTRKFTESSYQNNYFKRTFMVSHDQQNPYLEVTFDGRRIMNGDIVSPSPVIRISSTDQNKFLLQTDTTTFDLFLRKPGGFSFDRVSIGSKEVTFVPASDKNEAVLIYHPENLSDGTYSLKVQARDASGNKSGGTEFVSDFAVVNKSSITHFYPYPNPFTTSTRFVFTLTGSKVPEQLLVRILTLNGKVVREIDKDEFGPVFIGNNVSSFAWDGTDQYGDKLANGVYLYQVFTRIDGKTPELRQTKAKDESSFFLDNTGKIFLMR